MGVNRISCVALTICVNRNAKRAQGCLRESMVWRNLRGWREPSSMRYPSSVRETIAGSKEKEVLKMKVVKAGLPGFPMVMFRNSIEEVLKYYEHYGFPIADRDEVFIRVSNGEKSYYLWESEVDMDEEMFEEEYLPEIGITLRYAYPE